MNNITGLPNALTITRVLIIPIVVVLLYLPGRICNSIAIGLFLFACITDYLDGYFARAWQQTSAFGRFLDPIADKLLVAATLMTLVGLRKIDGLSIIPALIILCREILVSGLREFLAEVQVPLPVSNLAKWKTAIQMLSISCLIITPETLDILPFYTVGLAGLWGAAFLTLITGYDYLKASLQHMD